MASSPPSFDGIDVDASMVEIMQEGSYRCIPGLNPFDLLLFRSPGSLSILMQRISRPNKEQKDEIYWSHAGVAVDSSVLPDVGLEEGMLSVLESTLTSEALLGDEPDAVRGRGRLGVQVRRLDKVLQHYQLKKNEGFDVAYCNLKKAIQTSPTVVQIVQAFYNRHRDAHYQTNCVHLFAAVSPAWRRIRDSLFCRSVGSDDLFCSQLVAALYIKLGVLDPSVDARDVLPHDFLGHDPEGMPIIVHKPFRLI